MNLKNYIQNHYNFTELESRRISFIATSIFYDLTKLIIIGSIFLMLGKFSEFLLSSLVMLLIRPCFGGMHFKHYMSCLAFSFAMYFSAILLLPALFPSSKGLMLLLLALCMLCFFYFEPTYAKNGIKPSRETIHKSKKSGYLRLAGFILLFYILPLNPALISAFWMLLLQAIQLILSKCSSAFRKNYMINVKNSFISFSENFGLKLCTYCLFLFDILHFSKVSLILYGQPDYSEDIDTDNEAKDMDINKAK